MLKFKRSSKHRVMKSNSFLQTIKSSREILKGELETIHLVTETKCQALQDALAELEESRNWYADLYDLAPIGYVTIDHKGCILEINLTGAAMLGIERTQLIGKPLSVFFAKNNVKPFFDHLRRCRLTNEKVTTELILAAKSGVTVHVQLLSVPHEIADGNIQYKTIITDITERKMYEKELARLDRLNLVGEMAATIGHEVRNPMTTVRGFLQFYQGKDAFLHYKESFDLMIAELDRANSIITEFLSLAVNKTIDLKLQNMNTIIENIRPLIQADALMSDKNINMQLEEIAELKLNEKEIRQLILNLVRNGLEAMSPGGSLTIRTSSDSNGVNLSVQDQGKGIEPHIIEKLGTPFFTTKDNGTGLGLAVCYSIAARHNAQISIETSPSGTTFVVSFKVHN